MKKGLQLSIILVSTLFLSACGLQNSPTATNETTSGKFSLKDLIAKNIPQKCTFSGEDETGTYQGEILISGQKFRQTITTESDQGSLQTQTVSDGEYVYSWGQQAGQQFAMKLPFNFDATTSETGSAENNSASGPDLNTEYNLNCLPALVSDADFQPPQDIEFQDLGQFMQDIQSQIPASIPAGQ